MNAPGEPHFPSRITQADYIHALPQELFDEIYHRTFEAPKGFRYLDRTAEEWGYRLGHAPRPLLGDPHLVNLQSVDTVSAALYMKTATEDPGLVWVVPYLGGRSVDFLIRWLESRDKRGRELVSDVRCVIARDETRVSGDAVEKARGRLRNWIQESKVRFGTEAEITADVKGYRPRKPVPLPPFHPDQQPATVDAVAPPAQVPTLLPPPPPAPENFPGPGHIIGTAKAAEQDHPKEDNSDDFMQDSDEEDFD